MNDVKLMEIFKAFCNVFKLLVQLVVSSRGNGGQKSHQANPVRSLVLDIANDVSILHNLRNHRKPPIFRFDLYRDKLKDIRMRHVHPKYTFLAECLDSEFRFDQSLGIE